jgi:hypothetical protein
LSQFGATVFHLSVAPSGRRWIPKPAGAHISPSAFWHYLPIRPEFFTPRVFNREVLQRRAQVLSALPKTPLDFMKLIHRWFVFSCGWTRGQLWFLAFFTLYWVALACYATHRYDLAREAAIYWQQKALNQTFK